MKLLKKTKIKVILKSKYNYCLYLNKVIKLKYITSSLQKFSKKLTEIIN